jgi:hypothetical protein
MNNNKGEEISLLEKKVIKQLVESGYELINSQLK